MGRVSPDLDNFLGQELHLELPVAIRLAKVFPALPFWARFVKGDNPGAVCRLGKLARLPRQQLGWTLAQPLLAPVYYDRGPSTAGVVRSILTKSCVYFFDDRC